MSHSNSSIRKFINSVLPDSPEYKELRKWSPSSLHHTFNSQYIIDIQSAYRLRGYIHLCWSKKSKNFLLHFLKVHILKNLFPKNHEDLSSRTNLAAIDSALSATASHRQVTLHERSRFFAYRVKCGCGEHSFSRTVNPISLHFGRLTYNNNSL